jgi:hypothetical protein
MSRLGTIVVASGFRELSHWSHILRKRRYFNPYIGSYARVRIAVIMLNEF